MAIIDVLANLNRVKREMELKAERSIGQCAEDLLDKAVQKTPINTGELRLSGTEKDKKKGGELQKGLMILQGSNDTDTTADEEKHVSKIQQ